jgi:hypothetical protein
MLSLGSRGRILTETKSSLKEKMAELWMPADLLPYSPVSDFSIWGLLQEKVQAAPHANLAALYESITKEWDWLSAASTCRSFCRRLEAIIEKIVLTLNR